MMRYDIRLAIAYEYPGLVKDARHILRVSPREDRHQRVERARLDIVPMPSEIDTDVDFFANHRDHLLITDPHDRLSLTLHARVDVERPVPNLSATPSIRETARLAAESRDSEGASPIHFTGPSRLVSADLSVGAYVAAALAGHGPIGDAMLTLSHRIQSDFAYRPGVSTVATSVSETFARRRGVCQDFAHLMIAGLRAHGIPAAYVSGFLRTEPPAGQTRLAGADAMHAWVEVWCGPDRGWTGFDPTNGCLAGNDHIVVAVGRDYADVAPIDGVLLTSGPQKTHHSVDMVPLEPWPRNAVGMTQRQSPGRQNQTTGA